MLSKNNFNDGQNYIIDPSNFPESWTTIEYKNYPRFAKTQLQIDENLLGNFSITELLKKRNSDGSETAPTISFRVLSDLLYFSFGQKADSQKRFYPSAGSRYPLEFYVVVNYELEILKKGIYHYNVSENSLEFMWDNFLPENKFVLQDYKNDSQFFIIATSVIERSERKYANNALRFSYLETGCALQNLALLASAFGIQNSFVNHDDIFLEKLLDIDGEKEFVTGLFCLGFKKDNETKI